ncbi:MAG: DUF302 domain-containing protein [Solirubrobacteraceae bacterium]
MTTAIRTSPRTVAQTVDHIREQLDAKGVQLFATIDHAAGARSAGLELAEEVLLVFGNPAVGTGLMQDDPISGLDLPLRMLVWDDNGTTRVAYHPPLELAEDYAIDEHRDVLEKLSALLGALSSEA